MWSKSAPLFWYSRSSPSAVRPQCVSSLWWILHGSTTDGLWPHDVTQRYGGAAEDGAKFWDADHFGEIKDGGWRLVVNGSVRYHPEKMHQNHAGENGFHSCTIRCYGWRQDHISKQHPGFIIGSVQIVLSTIESSIDFMSHAYQKFEGLVDDFTIFIETRWTTY